MQACASPRACALPRPTLQRQGLLWVWAGGSGALAALEAAATPPVLAAELDANAEGVPTRASDGRKAIMRSYYYRELCAPPQSVAVVCASDAHASVCLMQTHRTPEVTQDTWSCTDTAFLQIVGNVVVSLYHVWGLVDHIDKACCWSQAIWMGYSRGEPDRPFTPALQPPHCAGQQVCSSSA